MKNSRSLILLLVLVSGLLLLAHRMEYQQFLATGDHGRDLYAASVAWQGQEPYRNYWWVYGPIMPYYYGLVFKVLGPSIHSMVIGKYAILLAAGLFVFLILSFHVDLLFAFAGTLWFWIFRPEFFFTYNHAGGIAAITAGLYELFAYSRTRKTPHLFRGLFWIVLLGLVKINFGATLLLTFVAAVYVLDRAHQVPHTRAKRIYYLLALIATPLLLVGIHLFFLRGLPSYVIHQCMIYLRRDHPYNAPLSETVLLWGTILWNTVNAGWFSRLFAVLIVMAAVQTGLRIKREGLTASNKEFLIGMGALAVLYVLNLHEFLASGVFYRTFWSSPASILMIFLLLGTALKKFSPVIRIALVVGLVGMVLLRADREIRFVQQQNAAGSRLDLPRAGIILGNSPEWLRTVRTTTLFLESRLAKGQTFFAMPYDPLYYFLTDRRSPTRQLIFFDHIHIPPQQEKRVIADLERHHVNYILMSNRIDSSETGLGVFGKTYCHLLDVYIKTHFHPIARFGDWHDQAGWAWNHGTLIWERNGTPRPRSNR